MIDLELIGIGAGHPDQITLQAIRALNRADVILVPDKGAEKGGLADIRRAILAEMLTNPAVRIVEFAMPVRDAARGDYRAGVEDWHDAIAIAWRTALTGALPRGGRAALMVWGDPSLYDSTLRIAGRLTDLLRVSVVPGVTALQALTAAFGIALNDIGAPVLLTTGRQLREQGWPDCAQTLAVFLDDGSALAGLDGAGVQVWWGANLGTSGEKTVCGRLADVRAAIAEARREVRARRGWVMDVYVLRRTPGAEAD